MTREHDIHEADIERLLRGEFPADNAVDGGVAQFLEGLDRLVAEEPTASLEAAHLSAMLASVLDSPAGPAVGPMRRLWPNWGDVVSSRWIKIAGISLAALLTFGGAAYAGVLPAPLQNAMSAAGRPLGLALPVSNQLHAVRVKSEPATPGARAASSRPSGTSSNATGTRSFDGTNSPSEETTASGAGHGAKRTGRAAVSGSRNNEAAAKRRATKKAAARKAEAKKKAAAKKATARKRATTKKASKKKATTKKATTKKASKKKSTTKKSSTKKKDVNGTTNKHDTKSGKP